jgi:hypothetical protein
MGRTTECLWTFRSPTKLHFQLVKNRVNRRILQADTTKLPKVARPENFWTASKAEVKQP